MSWLLWTRLIILKDSIVIDDIDANRININDHDLSSLKKHRRSKKATLQSVFKVSSELELYYNRALQDHENTASLNRSSEIDDSQDEYRTWIFNSKENDVWHFTDNSFVMQNDDIKTNDESTSAKIESNLSEINTADTQLNISCLTKESKTHHCLNFNAIVESFDRLCSFSVSSFENQERRTVHANDHNERTSAIVDFVSAIIIRLFAFEQFQSQDDWAETEKQKWKVIKILDKREIRSKMKYKIRWKSTWLFRSELESTQRLLQEYKTESWAQHECKQNRLVHKDKV